METPRATNAPRQSRADQRQPSRGDDTRRAVLDAAVAVFADVGYQRATVRDIVQRAGANVAAINYHFGDKHQLYLAAHEYARTTSNASNPLVQADEGRDFNADAPPDRRLYLFIRTMLGHVYHRGEPTLLARMMLHEMVQPTEALDRTIELSVRRVCDGLRQIVRNLAPEPVDERRVAAAARAVVLQIHGLHLTHAMWSRLEPDLKLKTAADLDHLAEDLWRFALAGLGHSVYDDG